MIHSLADVQTCKIGKNTFVWQYSIILAGVVIGDNCNINCHTFIENDVQIGSNVTIKSGVYLWDGINISDNVFVGPNVTFTNDERPRSKRYPSIFKKIKVDNNASIGAGAIILGGVTIGAFSMIGAGALVTRDVPERALVVGSPARITAWLNEDGTKMIKNSEHYIDNRGNKWDVKKDKLLKV